MKLPKPLLSLAAAHFWVDAYSSMLGAFLPFLHRQLNLSLSEAGILGGVLVFSSSLMQPIYGYLSDRFQSRLFVAMGPAVAGTFISALGLAPDFLTLVILIFLGGMGIAAFHPQGAAVTSEFSRERQSYHMSVFITGGMLGYSLGPIYITTLIAMAGLHSSYWGAVPGVLMSAFLLRWGPSPRKDDPQFRRSQFLEILRKKWAHLTVLYLLVVIRSIIQLVFVAFLPLYFTSLGYGEVRASQFLTLFLLAGGSAGFLGGVLADRVGARNILGFSMLGAFLFLSGFFLTSGALSVGLCALGGGFLLLSNPVNVVLAQRLVPNGTSTVSALMMGFAWGMGGLLIPLAGWSSDSIGLHATLSGLVLILLPGFFLTWLLPARRKVLLERTAP